MSASSGPVKTNLASTTAVNGVTGTLPIANGGTGQITAQAAVDALLPAQGSASGKFLTSNGSTSSWATVGGFTAVQAYYIGVPTGTLNASFNTATYPTKVTDTNNAYSSGTYTVPVTGYYSISAQLGITGTGTNVSGIGIFLNGSQISESYYYGLANDYPIVSLNGIYLTINDTIVIKGQSQLTGPVFIGNSISNWFSIIRVS